ncbi:MAG: phosphoglycerate dehydrogenase [Candidatus Limnocylindria bacterium]
MSTTSLPKDRIRVLLVENIDQSALGAFAAHGYLNIEHHRGALSLAELSERIRDAHILGIRSRTKIPESVLRSARKLMAIGCFCIGTDQVDLDAARSRGIPVFNAPFSNTRSVAELVIGETIMLCRGVAQRNAAAHRGQWAKSVAGAIEVRGKCLGIVGYGHIGTQVGVLAEAIGMQVIFYDVETKLALGNAKPLPSLEELLARADVVTLHVPDTKATAGLIGAEQLARMRPGAHLINASRGTVVDLAALADALRAGRIAGAAVDVFPVEPETTDAEFESPLRGLDNVILTPHVAGSTVEAQQSIGTEVAAKLIKYSDNGSSLTAVNFPEVALPEHRDMHRLLHIHENRPGMLAAVNSVLSASNINVASEYLETDRGVGYAVIDVDGAARPLSQAIRRELDAVPGTIRTRILY